MRTPGVTEAFTHAVLDHGALAASNLMMVAFTAFHVAACFVLVSAWGNRGLILADGLTMLLRICLSFWCVRQGACVCHSRSTVPWAWAPLPASPAK